jgi:hypothetical protein
MVFWFNFFPAQPALFEKTFAVWALFQMYAHRERGECNQLCAWEGKQRLEVEGVDPFVQVNLNRFSSLPGYFNWAHEAGRHTFTLDSEYLWYGMLLRKCPEFELACGIRTLGRDQREQAGALLTEVYAKLTEGFNGADLREARRVVDEL